METIGFSFENAVACSLNKFAVFRGRARRSETWSFNLFIVLIDLIVSMLLKIPVDAVIGWLVVICRIILIIPHSAVNVRRLHDTGRSGWWFLLSFLPIVNIILLCWLIQDSEKRENRYGKSPKYVDSNN
ncbi:MAG: DUF805 domain-containing protein [Bacteroides sp.]|nr:DUF805 domain-containing protein [Bacteroides sp.]MCM1086024.1 DUF805 domain-containing protein [Bacteroides sp.]